MAGVLQPLSDRIPIIHPDGRPTEYFIRWAQDRQIDISEGVSLQQVEELLEEFGESRSINAGTGLGGGGDLTGDVNLFLDAYFSQLNDVDMSTPPTNGQVPVWSTALQMWIPANQSGGGGGTGKPWYWDPPKAADFTLISGDATQLTLTDDDDVGLIVDGGAARTGDYQRFAYQTLSTPSLDWDCVLRMNYSQISTNFGACGIRLMDSVSGRGVGWDFDNSQQFSMQQHRFGSLSNVNSNTGGILRGNPAWLRVARIGSNLRYYFSADGKAWILQRTETVTAWLTNPPDRIGPFVLYNRADGPIIFSVDHFSLTGPAV